MDGEFKLLCYAEGEGENWEAFCLNFDLAVQGKSFKEVKQKLVDQIELYLESVDSLPEGERHALLNRKAPLGEWLKIAFYVFRNRFDGWFGRNGGKDFDMFSHRPRLA